MTSSGGAPYTARMLSKTFFTSRIAALVVPLFAATASAPAHAACIPDWSIAAPIVHKEGLTTVETLSRMTAEKLSENIVKTTLCEENGVFVYRIVVRDGEGRLRSRTLDARAPFAR